MFDSIAVQSIAGTRSRSFSADQLAVVPSAAMNGEPHRGKTSVDRSMNPAAARPRDPETQQPGNSVTLTRPRHRLGEPRQRGRQLFEVRAGDAPSSSRSSTPLTVV